ncbi:MAG: hypothetical protein H6Q90_2659 [Deltaproteobacteria bacterium]|nr:hypothetical protein [Deltaproteobacteria bacterium]
MRLIPRTIMLWLVVAPSAARAQVTFPPDTAYVPLRCGNAPMTDRFADATGALDERDLVGDGNAPAGLRAADSTNLYLRIRLEEDPAPAGAARPFSWGMEFDLDGDPNDYEVLVLVDGIGGGAATVEVFSNTMTTVPNDPNDPADQPAVASFPFAMNGRSVLAPGTTNGGSPDFFLDFAVPWSTLVPLGLDRTTMTRVWAASSSSANSLNGDVACHDGSSGSAQLSATASDPTTGDPTAPTGGGSGRLAGGGGCAASGGTTSAWLAIALLGLVRRRVSSVRNRRADAGQ